MANISLKRLFEAEDFKAKSKETGKLVHFKSKDSYQAALKAGTHEDPKAKKSSSSKDTKSNDMFGGDYSKDRGGETPKADSMATVNSIAAKTGLRATAVAGWADENGVNLSKVSDAINSKKLKPMDFMTAVSGNAGNKYAKDIVAKYSQSSSPKSLMGVDTIVYNKRTKTVGIVRMADERGETKTDADGNVNTDELEPYNPIKYPHQNDAKVAPSTQKEVDSRGLYNPFARTEESTKPTSIIKKTNENKMKNISLKTLLEAEDFQARSKQTGKLVHFKSKDAYQAALKAGSHEDPKAKKGSTPKADAKPNSMFGSDYSKDRGGEAPTKQTQPSAKSKYDDKSYWKDDEYSDTQGYYDYDDEDSEYDYDDGDSDDVRLTSDRLNKVETALIDDLDLRGNGFETTRESGGGMGGFEGPMTIVSKDADYNDDDNFISLSVGSPNNDGKFSIVFANSNGEPHFEPDYDALTGDNDLEPQQAYKVTKALMKMPEVQKVLKGEMKLDEFKPIYDKLKSKFSKTESTKLTSMIKK